MKVKYFKRCWCIFDTNCLILRELTSFHSEAGFNVTARFWKWCTTSLNKNVLYVAFCISVMLNLTSVAVLLQWCTDLCLILPGLRIYYVQVVHLFIFMLLRYIYILF
jgi:hypothetical protein